MHRSMGLWAVAKHTAYGDDTHRLRVCRHCTLAATAPGVAARRRSSRLHGLLLHRVHACRPPPCFARGGGTSGPIRAAHRSPLLIVASRTHNPPTLGTPTGSMSMETKKKFWAQGIDCQEAYEVQGYESPETVYKVRRRRGRATHRGRRLPASHAA